MENSFHIYNRYASFFFSSTGLEPMSYLHWMAIPELDRPGM